MSFLIYDYDLFPPSPGAVDFYKFTN